MKKIISIILSILVIASFAVFAIGSSESSSTPTEKKETIVNIGEKVTTNNLEISYVSCKDYKNYNEFFAPAKGNKIIALYFEVKNIGNTDAILSMFEFTCYADNVAMEEYLYGEDQLSTETLSSGRKMKGYIYYEVPKDAENIEVEYETDYWTNSKAIFVAK